jgi:hypothetical protein
LPFAERLLWFCSALSSLRGQVPTQDVNSPAEGNVLACTPLSVVPNRLLQTEDVATSKETVWGHLEAFGRNFCAFLEQAVEQKRLRDLAAKNQAENLEAR